MGILSASKLRLLKKSECDYMRLSACADECFSSVADLENQGLASSPVAFYDFLQNRVIIHFRARDEVEPEAGFELTLSKKMTYDMVRLSQF
jgi:ICP0-binding domain of Ubiquitin-specific protease 7